MRAVLGKGAVGGEQGRHPMRSTFHWNGRERASQSTGDPWSRTVTATGHEPAGCSRTYELDYDGWTTEKPRPSSEAGVQLQKLVLTGIRSGQERSCASSSPVGVGQERSKECLADYLPLASFCACHAFREQCPAAGVGNRPKTRSTTAVGPSQLELPGIRDASRTPTLLSSGRRSPSTRSRCRSG